MNKDFSGCDFLVIFLHQNDFLFLQFHANTLANSAICNSLPYPGFLVNRGQRCNIFIQSEAQPCCNWPIRNTYFPRVSAQYSCCWPVVTSKNNELLLPHRQSFLRLSFLLIIDKNNEWMNEDFKRAWRSRWN